MLTLSHLPREGPLQESGDFGFFFRDPRDLFKLNGGLNSSSVADQ